MADPGDPSSPVVIVCVGMAGVGKTTFMKRINYHLHNKNEAPYVINLDPAVLDVPYGVNIDIRDTVNYKKVMQDHNLGPNGGIVTSLNLFTTKVDQLIALLEKRARPDPEHPERRPITRIIIDTPGQIELFVWSASGLILLQALAYSFPTVIAYIADTPRSASASPFMANMLYACSILYRLKLPMVLVFNKTDVVDASFAKEWMTDFDSLQAAFRREEEEADDASSGGGTGYNTNLQSSLSLVLVEFYSLLDMVAVSARTGTGIDDFFVAVENKKQEYLRDYLPLVQERRRTLEQHKSESREKELDEMMQNVSVGGAGPAPKDDDDDLHVPSDDDSDSDSQDEAHGDGLQQRYQAAMDENQDSILADASFAKYLHKQR